MDIIWLPDKGILQRSNPKLHLQLLHDGFPAPTHAGLPFPEQDQPYLPSKQNIIADTKLQRSSCSTKLCTSRYFDLQDVDRRKGQFRME